jgi:hypothetical protein
MHATAYSNLLSASTCAALMAKDKRREAIFPKIDSANKSMCILSHRLHVAGKHTLAWGGLFRAFIQNRDPRGALGDLTRQACFQLNCKFVHVDVSAVGFG